jgi:exodeoxyribonuclease VII small subunit
VTDPSRIGLPLEADPPAPAAATAAAGTADVTALHFDEALDELRGVVARLEQGGMPLEESIGLYERGAALHDHCARLLDAAEARLARLVDGSGGAPRLVDLRPDDGDDA